MEQPGESHAIEHSRRRNPLEGPRPFDCELRHAIPDFHKAFGELLAAIE